MFDNFSCENEYHSCDVILTANDKNGYLLLGDFNSATDENILRQYSVKTVITSALGLDHLEIPSFATHIVYPLKDAKSENIRLFFQESFETIDKKLTEGGVLVHCAAGVSRSATLVIAYLMKKNQMTFKAAINFVRNRRSGICPNLGFEIQLKKYESQLQKKNNKNHREQKTRVEPKLMRKNISQKLNDQRKADIDLKEMQNKSLFLFEPAKTSFHLQGLRKKPEVKKGTTKHITFSKPKQKVFYDVAETELFVSGKGARRPSSQVRQSSESFKNNKKNSTMGTWGPKEHAMKHFQF